MSYLLVFTILTVTSLLVCLARTVAVRWTRSLRQRNRNTEKVCCGMCIMAGELIGGMPMTQVAYHHPECDLHREQ